MNRAKSLLVRIDKSAGVLAFLWVGSVYALVRFGHVNQARFFSEWELVILWLLLGWLAVGLLLVLAGLQRGNRVGRLCAGCAVGVLLLFAEPWLGLERKIGNLFRKDEYAFAYDGAPQCVVKVSIHTDTEARAFNEALNGFAKLQGIRKCRQKVYYAYSGPSRPTYKGDHVAMWSGVSWTTNSAEKTGGVRLAPYDRNFPPADFKRLADSLVNALRTTFPGRTEVTYKEPGHL